MISAELPRILLFAIQTSHAGSCRLPKLFKEAGFRVGVLGLRGSLLHATRYADEKFRLPARRFEPLIRHGLAKAFADFRPDVIVPCDERAVSVVNYWVGDATRAAALPPGLSKCLGRSLGRLERLPERASKLLTLDLARSIGLRAPRETVVTSPAEAREAAAAFGYPVVLKLSHGAGGNGVRLCETPDQLDAAFRSYGHTRSTVKAWRRRLLRRNWFGSQCDMLVQEFIRGRPAMSCVAAVGGRSLAIATGFAERVTEPMGPASIVRIVDIPEIRRATERMVKEFGASGFLSFDFVIGPSGEAVLLECNPRPTQIMHLGSLVGVDLARSFRLALQGRCEAPCKFPRGEREAAFFPQEWTRNPGNPILATAFHDVPWEDPALLRAMLGKRPVTWRRRHIP
jgi:hypothetical protein